MSDKDDGKILLIGAGIIIGAAFVVLVLHKLQTQSTPSSSTPTPQPPSESYMKWYADEVLKPSIEITARLAAKETVNAVSLSYDRPVLTVAGQTNHLKVSESGQGQGSYKNNESWEFKRGADGRLQSINVIRNAKTTTTPTENTTTGNKT